MTFSRLCLAAIGAVSLLAPSASAAHGQAVVRPGSTVRLALTGQDQSITGVLSGLTDDAWTIVLPDGRAQRISPASVSATEVQVTRRHTLRGALIGGGVGLASGLILVLTDDDKCDRDATGICDVIVGTTENVALVWGTVGGAALGALVGTLVTSKRWVPGVVPGAAGGPIALRWSLPSPR